MSTPLILIINDDPSVLILMRALLEDAGYRVETTLMVIALEQIHQLHPDLLIIDLLLGQERDGLLLMRDVQQHPALVTLPIICSIDAIEEHRGFHTYLHRHGVVLLEKPVNVTEFIALIQSLLRQAD